MADSVTQGTWDIGKGWRRVLVGSLAVNLLIAGLIGGAMMGGGTGGRFGGVDMATGPLVAALSDADRDAIRTAVRQADRPRHGGGLQAERQAVLAALRATPFEPGAVAAALDDMRARVGSASDIAQAALVARIAGMTAADRAAFADRLERELNGGRDRRDDH